MSCNCKTEKISNAYQRLVQSMAKRTIASDIQSLSGLKYKLFTQFCDFSQVRQEEESNEIIKSLLELILNYKNDFKLNFDTLMTLVVEIEKDNQVMIRFKNLLSKLSTQINIIDEEGKFIKQKLDTNRNNLAEQLRNIAGDISTANRKKQDLEIKINQLSDGISALDDQLSELNWTWALCVIPLVCAWLTPLLQEVAFNKSAKESERRQKYTELNNAKDNLVQLQNHQEFLQSSYDRSTAFFNSVVLVIQTTAVILNNVSGVYESLSDLDPDNTATLLTRQLAVLKLNWDDLVALVETLSTVARMNTTTSTNRD